MAATLHSTAGLTVKQTVAYLVLHLQKNNNAEVELSTGCTFRLWTEKHSRRVSAKILVPNYFTYGAVEHRLNPSTVQQLNTLLVLTYGTSLMLAQTSEFATAEFQYILFATEENFFDKFVEAATFIEKVLDNLPGNVVQLTSTKEENAFNFYKDYY